MITFTRVVPGTYDPATGLYTGGSTSSVTGSAIQVRGSPQRYKALELNIATMPTLLFTPSAYPLRANSDEFVMPGDTVEWGETVYRVLDVDAVAPDGFVIVARIVVGA